VDGVLYDSISISQLIEGKQDPVYIATSLSLSSSDTATQNEGITVPPAEAFSGKIDIEVGIGRLPAIILIGEQALENANQQTSLISAYDLLTAIVPDIAASQYNASEDEFTKFSTQKKKSIQMIYNNYLDLNKGIIYFPSDTQSLYIDVSLNAFGAFILRLAGDTSYDSEILDAISRGIEQQWSDNPDYEVDYNEVAWFHYFLGLDWTVKGRDEYSFSSLFTHSSSLSAEGKAALAISLLRENNATDNAQNILLTLQDLTRVQGRTAYLSHESGDQQPAREASALFLHAITKIGTPQDVEDMGIALTLVEKIANFLAGENYDQTQPQPYYSWIGPRETLTTLLALAAYDDWKGNTDPSLTLTVTSGDDELLSGSFNSSGEAPIRANVLYEDISDTLNINFTVIGSGEASIVLGTSFVPADMPLEGISRGVTVNKIIQLVDPASGEPLGPAITKAKVGNQVKVSIEISISDYASRLQIVDLLPGCLEALDDSIFSVPPQEAGWDAKWSWYYYHAFSKEFLPSKVIFHGSWLWAGTHTVSYYALVASEGEFVLPPATAFYPTEPEVMGLSAGGSFQTKVLDPTPVEVSENCLEWKNQSYTTGRRRTTSCDA